MSEQLPLIAKNISFSYISETPIISDFSIELEPGKTYILTGTSGSGKSTAMYLLSTLLRPKTGELHYGDINLSYASDSERAHWRAQTTGLMFQDAILDQGRSVLDNVLEPTTFTLEKRSNYVQQALELMERFGVAARPQARPGQLSGGQAQRIGLCRALIRNPPILFADEPTGNLDSDTGDIVWEALANHAADGAIVVVATHQRNVDIPHERVVFP
ncbi:MAG: ABC transporter ATP-binding protein [Propionibacteriaceae bacterium]